MQYFYTKSTIEQQYLYQWDLLPHSIMLALIAAYTWCVSLSPTNPNNQDNNQS
jgi:hypothetical protein